MKSALIVTTAVLAVGMVAEASASCKTKDLRGRWDVYGFAGVLDATASLDCVFNLNRDGRAARAVCIVRSNGESESIVIDGALRIKNTCEVSGTLNGGLCTVNGTMTRSKDTISGVYDCDSTGAIALISLVKR